MYIIFFPFIFFSNLTKLNLRSLNIKYAVQMQHNLHHLLASTIQMHHSNCLLYCQYAPPTTVICN